MCVVCRDRSVVVVAQGWIMVCCCCGRVGVYDIVGAGGCALVGGAGVLVARYEEPHHTAVGSQVHRKPISQYYSDLYLELWMERFRTEYSATIIHHHPTV